MRVNPITSTDKVAFRGNPIRINDKDNKEVKFLYNKIQDVIKEERIGAVFNLGSDGFVNIDTPKPTTLEKLKELGIKFVEVVKGKK